MQTMPRKTRTAMTVGAILLVAVVGAVALYASRGKTPTTQNTSDTHVTQGAAGTHTQQPATTNPALGAVTAEKGPTQTGAVTGTGAAAGTGVMAGTGAAAAAGTGAVLPLEGGSAATMAGATVPETYTVAAGDSLRTIAMQFYGDPIYSADIEKLNALPDPDVITMGQVLKMPALADVKH